MPISTNQIDLEAVKRDRDLLWAEASILEAEGAPITLPRGLWKDARKTQEDRKPIDPWVDLLQDIKPDQSNADVERISTNTLFGTYLETPANQRKDFHSKRLGEVMRMLGWNGPKLMRINGKTQRGYERPVGLKEGGEDDLVY